MRNLQLSIFHHHQLDHHHQLNKGIAPEELKDPDHVRECIHVHPRFLFGNSNVLYLYVFSRIRQLRAKMKIQHLGPQNRVSEYIEGHRKIKKTHGNRVHKPERERQPRQKKSRVSHQRARITRLRIQMKTIKSFKMSLEAFQILSPRY